MEKTENNAKTSASDRPKTLFKSTDTSRIDGRVLTDPVIYEKSNGTRAARLVVQPDRSEHAQRIEIPITATHKDDILNMQKGDDLSVIGSYTISSTGANEPTATVFHAQSLDRTPKNKIMTLEHQFQKALKELIGDAHESRFPLMISGIPQQDFRTRSYDPVPAFNPKIHRVQEPLENEHAQTPRILMIAHEAHKPQATPEPSKEPPREVNMKGGPPEKNEHQIEGRLVTDPEMDPKHPHIMRFKIHEFRDGKARNTRTPTISVNFTTLGGDHEKVRSLEKNDNIRMTGTWHHKKETGAFIFRPRVFNHIIPSRGKSSEMEDPENPETTERPQTPKRQNRNQGIEP